MVVLLAGFGYKGIITDGKALKGLRFISRLMDYVSGEDVVERLSLQSGNIGFYLASIHKNELFKTVILDGALPRKTFSMGEAKEKRFYMEARRITK